jgi:hypothetical protein
MHQPTRDLQPPHHPARESAHQAMAAVIELDHLEHLVQTTADL